MKADGSKWNTEAICAYTSGAEEIDIKTIPIRATRTRDESICVHNIDGVVTVK